MKSRVDASMGSQLKRPAMSSRPEQRSSGNPLNVEVGGVEKLTTNDALAYLKAVKDIHSLPKGYEITLPSENEALQKKPVEFEEAIKFVNKIKHRFRNEDHIYKRFLEILNMYRRESRAITDVYQEVAILFRQHQDLLDEFTHFLPEAGAVHNGQPSTNRNFVDHDDRRSVPSRPINGDKERSMSSHADCDLSFDHTSTGNKAVVKINKEQQKCFDGEYERKEEKERREHHLDDKDLEHGNNKDFNMQRIAQRRKSAKRDAHSISEHSQGGEVAENMRVSIVSPSTCVNNSALKSVYSEEFTF